MASSNTGPGTGSWFSTSTNAHHRTHLTVLRTLVIAPYWLSFRQDDSFSASGLVRVASHYLNLAFADLPTQVSLVSRETAVPAIASASLSTSASVVSKAVIQRAMHLPSADCDQI